MSPRAVPAARFKLRPGAAATEVISELVLSTDLPAKLSVTLTLLQYLASALAATLWT